jgi:hypothetical protein
MKDSLSEIRFRKKNSNFGEIAIHKKTGQCSMVYFHKTLYVKKEKSENMVIAIFLPWKIINFIFIPGKLLVRMRECGSRILVTRREL